MNFLLISTFILSTSNLVFGDENNYFDHGFDFSQKYNDAFSQFSEGGFGAGFHSNGDSINTISQPVPYSVPQPYPVTVIQRVPYPVPVRVPIPVPRAVEIAVPVPRPVTRPRPYPVVVTRPYTVRVPYPVPVPVPQHVRIPVPQPYQVTVNQEVPVKVPQTVVIPVPRVINLGSAGNTGFTTGRDYHGDFKSAFDNFNHNHGGYRVNAEHRELSGGHQDYSAANAKILHGHGGNSGVVHFTNGDHSSNDHQIVSSEHNASGYASATVGGHQYKH